MSDSFNAPLWNMAVYAELLEEVDPYLQLERFRTRDAGFKGNRDFWLIPSPEPRLPETLIEKLSRPIEDGSALRSAVRTLAAQITAVHDPAETLFVAILRAGVPVTDWLTRLLPGSNGVATSLFVGHGIDCVALQRIRADYPDRNIVFVDGWTGKGGVATALSQLAAGPLAVLCDPWRLADYRGTTDDLLSPTACFTGPLTMGFSRTFTRSPVETFAAYRFPPVMLCRQLVEAWNVACPTRHFESPPQSAWPRIQHSTTLRVHSNEVCRALINAQPEVVMFADSMATVRQEYALLLELADAQRIPQQFGVMELRGLDTRVACRLRLAI